MRRIFWALLGVGLGVVVGGQVVRWTAKTKQRLSPPGLAREAGGKLDELRARLTAAIDEGRDEMVVREAELRAELRLPPG